MYYLTGKAILDAAQTLHTDRTSGMRLKMLTWLNLIIQDLVIRRKWNWLRKTVTGQTITASGLTLPADYSEFVGIEFSDGSSHSFTESFTELEFSPEVTTGVTADLTYIQHISDVSDTATATALPTYLKPALVNGVMSYAFIYDKDEQYSVYPQIYEGEINKLKIHDNRFNALPTYTDIGYPVRRNGLGVI